MGTDISQHLKALIEEAIQILEAKVNDELYLITKQQIALQDGFKKVNESFAYRLIVLGNKSSHLEKAYFPSHSKMKIPGEFVNYLGTVRHDVNQLVEVHNEIRIEVDLRSTRVADWLGRVEAYMATVPGNIRTSSVKDRSQKEVIKVSRLL